jgi:Mn2+/Fe2+ NRAMP family transporter
MDTVAAAIQGGDSDAARTALNDKVMRNAEAAYLSALVKLDEQQRAAGEAATQDAQATYAGGRNLLFGAALLACALAAVLGLGITRSITRQLGAEPAAAAELARSVSQGDLSLRVNLRDGDSTSMAVFAALAGRAQAASPGVMVAGVFVGSALWWLILSTGVGWLRERFDDRWQRAVNLISAALLAGLGLWQLGQLVAW